MWWGWEVSSNLSALICLTTWTISVSIPLTHLVCSQSGLLTISMKSPVTMYLHRSVQVTLMMPLPLAKFTSAVSVLMVLTIPISSSEMSLWDGVVGGGEPWADRLPMALILIHGQCLLCRVPCVSAPTSQHPRRCHDHAWSASSSNPGSQFAPK